MSRQIVSYISRRWKGMLVIVMANLLFVQFVLIQLREAEFDEAHCPRILPSLQDGSLSIDGMRKVQYVQEEKKIGDHQVPIVGRVQRRPYLNCLDQEDELLHRTIRDQYFDRGNGTPRGLSKRFEDIKHVYQVRDLKKIFHGIRNGFFIEAGSVDGEFMSISLPFEIDQNWSGLLVEADPADHELGLLRNRNATYVNTCLALKDRPHFSSFLFEPPAMVGNRAVITMAGLSETERPDSIKVQCFPLYSLLKAAGNPTVNLFILDIEGAELAVLKTIPWDKVDIQVMTIETDLIGKTGIRGGSQEEARQFLKSKGYEVFKHSKDFNPITGLQNNDLFIREDIVKRWNIKQNYADLPDPHETASIKVQ